MARRKKRHAKNPEYLAKVEKAITLRIAGLTFAAIAQQMDCSEGTAYNLVNSALERKREVIAAHANHYRKLETDRLDYLQRVWWPRAVGGRVNGQEFQPDLKAAKFVMDLIMKRAALQGLVGSGADKDAGITNIQDNRRVTVFTFNMDESKNGKGVLFDGNETDFKRWADKTSLIPQTISGDLRTETLLDSGSLDEGGENAGLPPMAS